MVDFICTQLCQAPVIMPQLSARIETAKLVFFSVNFFHPGTESSELHFVGFEWVLVFWEAFMRYNQKLPLLFLK